MNWYKQLNKLLGFFWLHVWKESWLPEMLGKFLHFIVGRNLFSRLQSIQTQIACTSLQVPDHTRYIPIFITSDSTGSSFGISKVSIQFNQTTPEISKLLYTKRPDWLQFSVTDDSEKIVDFDWTDGIIKLNIDVTQKMVGNTLWAVYNSYNTLSDKFTGIMQLPLQWIYKYPGAIQAAWNIKQNGASRGSVIDLLTAIGGNGMIGQKLYPSIYTDELPPWLSGIHVITEVGVLYANKIDTSTSDNCLPLHINKGGVISSSYKNKCLDRQQDSEIPHVELQSADKSNPAQFIFKTVWGPCGIIIITPPVTEDNRNDIKTAVKFIQKNTALGTILLAYTPEQELLYPDKQAITELLTYYEHSINNNTESRHKAQG